MERIMKDLIINGYKLICCDDDALYVAKTKKDVLDFYKENYGEPIDNLLCSDSEFLEELIIYDLDSQVVQKQRIILNDDNGEKTCKSYYEYYIRAAKEDKGCQPVLWFNI